ncbi:hypothetical protein BGZ95_002524, partial [Linnemannia exigua]
MHGQPIPGQHPMPNNLMLQQQQQQQQRMFAQMQQQQNQHLHLGASGKSLPPGFSGLPPGMPPGMQPGMSPGMPPGISPGMQPGMSQAMPGVLIRPSSVLNGPPAPLPPPPPPPAVAVKHFDVDINEQVVQALLELNKELISVCIDYQANQLSVDPDFMKYVPREPYLSKEPPPKPDLSPLPPARFPSAVRAMAALPKVAVAYAAAEKERKAKQQPKPIKTDNLRRKSKDTSVPPASHPGRSGSIDGTPVLNSAISPAAPIATGHGAVVGSIASPTSHAAPIIGSQPVASPSQRFPPNATLQQQQWMHQQRLQQQHMQQGQHAQPLPPQFMPGMQQGTPFSTMAPSIPPSVAPPMPPAQAQPSPIVSTPAQLQSPASAASENESPVIVPVTHSTDSQPIPASAVTPIITSTPNGSQGPVGTPQVGAASLHSSPAIGAGGVGNLKQVRSAANSPALAQAQVQMPSSPRGGIPGSPAGQPAGIQHPVQSLKQQNGSRNNSPLVQHQMLPQRAPGSVTSSPNVTHATLPPASQHDSNSQRIASPTPNSAPSVSASIPSPFNPSSQSPQTASPIISQQQQQQQQQRPIATTTPMTGMGAHPGGPMGQPMQHGMSMTMPMGMAMSQPMS